MPSLTNKVRSDLLNLMSAEINLVQAKAEREADAQWQEAEKEVAQQLGYLDVTIRVEHIKNQIEGLQTELSELEAQLHEKARPATVEHYRDAGIEVTSNRYGQVYRRPMVFGRQIVTQWDCLVLQHLNSKIPFFKVHFNLAQLNHVVHRELLLCGNFEEVRALYQRFHEKIGKAIGNDLPGLMAEVDSLPMLQDSDTTQG